jgi:hypothetical protein
VAREQHALAFAFGSRCLMTARMTPSGPHFRRSQPHSHPGRRAAEPLAFRLHPAALAIERGSSMSATSLRDFVSRTLEHKRIRFGDLRRLQRDILPTRITTREQAEVLIALDSSVGRADREWRQYLIATIRDFAIWGSPPVGRIDKEKADWLTPCPPQQLASDRTGDHAGDRARHP